MGVGAPLQPGWGHRVVLSGPTIAGCHPAHDRHRVLDDGLKSSDNCGEELDQRKPEVYRVGMRPAVRQQLIGYGPSGILPRVLGGVDI